LIDLQPGQGQLHGRRGRAYAQLGLWQKAARDYAKATALEPNNIWWAHEHAGIRLMCGDTEGYRQTCARLFQRFGQTTDPTTAYLVARTFVLAPSGGPDAAKAVELAARAVAGEPTHRWNWHTLGAAYYRAGEFEQVIRRLHQALAAKARADPLDWLVLAMAYQRQGNADEARKWLDKAVLSSNRLAQNMPPGAPNAIQLHLHDWTAYHLLRREAEALINGKMPPAAPAPREKRPPK
jgi:tetratricopeptide (TPR) repeat protein